MTLATKRKLALWLFIGGAAALIFSIKYYKADQQFGEMYSEQFGDKLDRFLKSKAAEEGAAPCGRLHVSAKQVITSPCPDSAVANEKPFYASYAIETGDGDVTYRGLLRRKNGTYEEYAWNPGKEVTAIFRAPDPSPVACVDPHQVRHNWQGIVTCTDMH